MMITKEQCIVGTKCIINSKKSKNNQNLGSKQNGLMCHVPENNGISIDTEKELAVGTLIEILSEPKPFGNSGIQIKFKVQDSNEIFASWWSPFKQKIDICW